MRSLKDYVTPAAMMILAGVILFDHFAPRAVAPAVVTVDGRTLGKAYGPLLLASYAEAWVAAAKAIEDGKSVSEAQKVLQDTWKEVRTRSFQAKVEPGFVQVLPEGSEPAGPAQRGEVAKLWRAFAKGLNGGR